MRILNLTQHAATTEQVADGVFELQGAFAEAARALLNIEALPDTGELHRRANRLAGIAGAHRCDAAMIGGAPYLMPHLERELVRRNVRPLYAFSRRESVETTRPDGSVVKTAVFRHAGWVAGFWPGQDA